MLELGTILQDRYKQRGAKGWWEDGCMCNEWGTDQTLKGQRKESLQPLYPKL